MRPYFDRWMHQNILGIPLAAAGFPAAARGYLISVHFPFLATKTIVFKVTSPLGCILISLASPLNPLRFWSPSRMASRAFCRSVSGVMLPFRITSAAAMTAS